MLSLFTDKDVETKRQKDFRFYTPNPKQASFHKAGEEAIERLFLAGNRTGKTYCGCIEDAIHLTGIYPDWWEGHRFEHPIVAWVASENYEITRNVLQKMLIGGYSSDGSFTDGLIYWTSVKVKAICRHFFLNWKIFYLFLVFRLAIA